MKIIFLDFDGVLNFASFLYKRDKTDIENRWENQINPEAVKLLNKLVEKTSAKVVISSSWRISNTIDELRGYLKHHGFIGEVIDITPYGIMIKNEDGLSVYGRRGNEIQEWLDNCGLQVESFVIIDDDSDMAHLMPRLVKTSFSIGLLEEHVELAINLLEACK